MKNTPDLVAAVARMHEQYGAGRIDREILCGWVKGLPSYSGPLGSAVSAAKTWFATKQAEITGDVREDDLARLSSIFVADGETTAGAGAPLRHRQD